MTSRGAASLSPLLPGLDKASEDSSDTEPTVRRPDCAGIKLNIPRSQ